MSDWWGTFASATNILSEGIQTVTAAIEQDFASAQENKPQPDANAVTTSVWDEWDDDPVPQQPKQEPSVPDPNARAPRTRQTSSRTINTSSSGLNMSASNGGSGSVRASQGLGSSMSQSGDDEWDWEDDARKKRPAAQIVSSPPKPISQQPSLTSKPATNPTPSARVQSPLTSSSNNSSNNSISNALKSSASSLANNNNNSNLAPKPDDSPQKEEASPSEWTDDWDSVPSMPEEKETKTQPASSANSNLTPRRDEPNSASESGAAEKENENWKTVREISRDELDRSSEREADSNVPEEYAIVAEATADNLASSKNNLETLDDEIDYLDVDDENKDVVNEVESPIKEAPSEVVHQSLDEPIIISPDSEIPNSNTIPVDARDPLDSISVAEEISAEPLPVPEVPLQSIIPEVESLHQYRDVETIAENISGDGEESVVRNSDPQSSADVQALKEQLKFLLSERAQRERAHNSAEAELKTLRDIMTRKDQLFRTADGEMKAMREDLIKKENLIRSQEALMNALKEEVNKKDKQARDASAELQTMRNSFGGKDEILLKAKAENKQLREEGSKLMQETVKHQDTAMKLKSEKNELIIQLRDLREKFKVESEEHEQTRASLEKMKQSKLKYKEALSDIKNASKETQNQIDDLHTYKQEYTDQIKELKNALDKSWSENANLQKEMQSMTQRAKMEEGVNIQNVRQQYESKIQLLMQSSARIEEELKSTISALRVNVTAEETRLGLKADSHTSQIELLLEKNFKLESELATLRETKNETDRNGMKQLIELENELLIREKKQEIMEKNYRSELDQLKKEKNELLQEQERLNAESQEVQVALKDHKHQNRDLLRHVNQSKLKCEEYAAQIKTQVTTLTQKIEALESNLANSLQKIAEAEALQSQKTEQVKKVTEERNLLKSQLNESQTQISILQGRLQDRSVPLTPVKDAVPQTPLSSPAPKLKLSDLESIEIPNVPVFTIDKSMTREKALLLLEQQQGEILTLHSMITSLTNSKKLLENEIVALSTQIESNKRLIESCKTLKDEFNELKLRYSLSLELIGEREEQVELLSNDLNELKLVYKQHINALSVDPSARVFSNKFG